MTSHGSAIISDMLRESIADGVIPKLTITSNSMAPLLQTGDEIGLAAADVDMLTPFSIITFDTQKRTGVLLTHRVAKSFSTSEEPVIITWADRSLLFDKPIDAPQIIGQVIWRMRDGKKISLDAGWGQWLNKKLCLLAQKEMRNINGYAPEEISQSDSIAEINELRNKNLISFRYRLLKWIGRIQAEILSSFANVMNQITGASQGDYAH